MCDKEGLEKLQQFILETNEKQTKDIKQHIDKEITEIRKILEEEEKAKRNELEQKYLKLKENYIILEKSLRKNNIIIFGVEQQTEATLLESTIEVLNSHLKLNLNKQDINNIYTIGKQTQKKPIIVKLILFLTKLEILKAAKNLKGTGIVISEELNLEERNRNKILRQNLNEARSKGLSAYIKSNVLYVNGTKYTAEQLADNEEDSDKEESKEKQGERIDTIPPENISRNLKKRPNENTEERIEKFAHLELNKRRVVTSGIQRSSPRLNDKVDSKKTNNELKNTM